jgi:precorrin-2 methylase
MGKQIGTLYGVSVGTGDPELITVKGQRLLQQVRVIAFPIGFCRFLKAYSAITWFLAEHRMMPIVG